VLPPGGSLVKEHSWIDPDFQESLTKRFDLARARHFFWIIKNYDSSSFSHVTHVFVCKQTVISCVVLFVLKCSFVLSVILSYYWQACAKRSHAGIVFTQWSKNRFSPDTGATRCPDKREIGHGGAGRSAPRTKFHVYWGRSMRI